MIRMLAAALFVLLSLMQYISVSFQRGCVTCDESRAIIHTVHLRLIYENTSAIGVFVETSSATVRQNKKFLFLETLNRTRSARSEASQIVAENLTNSIKSRKCRHLIRKPYCTSFAM